MQIGEVQFFDGPAGTGNPILGSSNAIIGIDGVPAPGSSGYPGHEGPALAIDGTAAKYLNFGRANSGLIVVPGVGPTIADGFRLMTANDADGRDPVSYSIYGGNGPVASADNSEGTAEAWTLIQSGSLSPTNSRDTFDPLVPLANSAAYSRYKILFPQLRNGAGELMQIGEFELHGTAVPEPGSLGLGGLALGLLARRRNRGQRV